MVNHQHDNLSVSRNTLFYGALIIKFMSIAFLFHVVNEYCLYDSMTNSMITTTSLSIIEKNKVIIRKKLY